MADPLMAWNKNPIRKPEQFVNIAAEPVPSNVDAGEKGLDGEEEAAEEGYSVFVKCLPVGCPPAWVEEELIKFGPIKPNGIQVLRTKGAPYSYAFVKFQHRDSVQKATKVSPIKIRGNLAWVYEKRCLGSIEKRKESLSPSPLPTGFDHHPDRTGCAIMLPHLPEDATTDMLRKECKQFGRITDVEILPHRFLGRLGAVHFDVPRFNKDVIRKIHANPLTIAGQITKSFFLSQPDETDKGEKNYSVCIKDLPLGCKPAWVKEEFKKFGPIKPNGIEVRHTKGNPYCYAFVEFEHCRSVQEATKESHANFQGRPVRVYVKYPYPV